MARESALQRRQPPWPLLEHDAWLGDSGRGQLRGVTDLPHQWPLTSGRAALVHGLRALGVGPGARVAVPSYHCPTLVAPVVEVGAQPVFYALAEDGRPDAESLAALHREGALAAVIASHLFGFARSLAGLRAWCDAEGVALVEDCAHALWGPAGERVVGHWGDVATASLAKFLPLPEGGLLASARSLPAPVLRRPGLRAELKTVKDLFDRRRLGRSPLHAASPATGAAPPAAEPSAGDIVRSADMGRAGQALPWASHALWRLLPWAAAARRRRQHWNALAAAFAEPRPGLRPLWPLPDLLDPADAAAPVPYVFPLWADDPEPLYARLRAGGHAVLRWDRVWPGAPDAGSAPGDPGVRWRRHVLQLLVHQSLGSNELEATLAALNRQKLGDLGAAPAPGPHRPARAGG